jgi:hypothetical protein
MPLIKLRFALLTTVIVQGKLSAEPAAPEGAIVEAVASENVKASESQKASEKGKAGEKAKHRKKAKSGEKVKAREKGKAREKVKGRVRVLAEAHVTHQSLDPVASDLTDSGLDGVWSSLQAQVHARAWLKRKMVC